MIFYPGDVNQPCQAEYGIAITREPSITRVDIVVIDPREAGLHQSSLLNTDLSRDLVLNKIFLIDLLGIRIDFMRFFVIVDAESPFGMDGYEFPVRLDFEDYRQKGNPVQIKKVAPTSIKGWLRYVLGFHVSVRIEPGRGGRVRNRQNRPRARPAYDGGGGALALDCCRVSGTVDLPGLAASAFSVTEENTRKSTYSTISHFGAAID
jgi:hypothetical protein